jgi:hypothetical protein
MAVACAEGAAARFAWLWHAYTAWQHGLHAMLGLHAGMLQTAKAAVSCTLRRPSCTPSDTAAGVLVL